MIDFLIAGTFKSASSTLAYELRQHPGIDIPLAKDPYYFLADLCREMTGPDGFMEAHHAHAVYHRAAFETLFQSGAGATLKGEATPLYLYCHEHAIPAIRDDNPDARIILVLRNPADRALSNYAHNVKDGYEPRSFGECVTTWEKTESLPLHPFFHYVRAGFYDAQVAAYLGAFEHVKIISYDDVKAAPHHVLNEIATFLGLEPVFPERDVIRLNKSGRARSQFLHDFIGRKSTLKSILRPAVRTLVPSSAARIAISEKVKNLNLKQSEMAPSDRMALASLYRDDVARLSERVGRNFAKEWDL